MRRCEKIHNIVLVVAFLFAGKSLSGKIVNL